VDLLEENAKLKEALKSAAKLADRLAVEANPRAYMRNPGPPDTNRSVVQGQCDLAVHVTARAICYDICKMAEQFGIDTSDCVTQIR